MITFYRYKNEHLGMEFIDIPELYRNLIREQYKQEVQDGTMTVEHYEQLTKEVYLVIGE